jgi:UTP--glucose-1-phosphate uridylyltransferase
MVLVQASFPRIRTDSLHPVDWPSNRQLEWNPNGHGDVVRLLATSGTVDSLLRAGFRHLFVANSDNLGGIPTGAEAAYFEDSGWDLMAEVVPRTLLDIKGGHPATRLSDGRLIIRETAQLPQSSRTALPARFYLHNTGNFWLRLEGIKDAWKRWQPAFPFPAVQTAKEAQFEDGKIGRFRQLELSLGGAFDFFDRTGLLRVRRERFIPVKSREDLHRVQQASLWLDSSGRPRGIPAPDVKQTIDTSGTQER